MQGASLIAGLCQSAVRGGAEPTRRHAHDRSLCRRAPGPSLRLDLPGVAQVLRLEDALLDAYVSRHAPSRQISLSGLARASGIDPSGVGSMSDAVLRRPAISLQ